MHHTRDTGWFVLEEGKDLMPAEAVFRGLFAAVLVAVVAISSYHRAHARRSGEAIPRRAEGSFVLSLRLTLALLALASFITYIFAPGWLAWAQIGLPAWLRWAAAAIAVACLPAVWWVFASIGNNISETILTKRTHTLATHGPYRWIRHPLYAFALLELFCLALVADNWLLLLWPCIGGVVFSLIVIPREEANLIDAFGMQYEEYRGHTGALLPRLWA